MLGDIDIKSKMTDGKIKIEPFEDKFLTGVGYDLRVGLEAFSWKTKKSIKINIDGKIIIEPNDTVVIRTLESIELSKKIGATIHSVVSQVVPNGLSHISTTIDPGWKGKLLVSLHNYLDSSVELGYGDYFCTVCFYEINTEVEKLPTSRPDRDDMWVRLLEKAKEESKRLKSEEKDKRIKRLLIKFALSFCIGVFGIWLSFLFKPENAAIVATIIAALIPFLIELYKEFE